VKPDFVWKLERAFDHVKSLDVMLSDWIQGQGTGVLHEPDPQTGEVIVYLVVGNDPEDVGLLIGECLPNARSALDNLAYALAEDPAYGADPAVVGLVAADGARA
jgi:hypothetical protein